MASGKLSTSERSDVPGTRHSKPSPTPLNPDTLTPVVPIVRKTLKVVGGIAVVIVLAGSVTAGWIWSEINASLPIYDGEVQIEGLSSGATVERDSLGVATIRSANATDEARTLGFVHAQERFFQMDLIRRAASGELSALVGPSALGVDEQRRVHLLRQTAERVVRAAPSEYRLLLAAYTEGVNAGLGALGAKPFEYLLLRGDPVPWVEVDSILVLGAMFFDLQDHALPVKLDELVARGVLPTEFADFLYPSATVWDAPLIGDSGPPATIPSADVFDLRSLPRDLFATNTGPVLEQLRPAGSNNWAVAASETETGRAIVANDMHLDLGVPSIWFRVSLESGGRRVTGVTLPGLPAVVAGSNEHVAWGLTNSFGDWIDLIVLELDPEDPNRYLTPEGWMEFETVSSPIEVAHDEDHEFTFRRTIWGPVLGESPDGTPYAGRWVAHDSRGYALNFIELAEARTVEEALEIAQSSGSPQTNFVVADSDGNIGWTIMGAVPRRVDTNSVSYSAEGSAWEGWLEPDEYPVVVNPPDGRIWTANGRVVTGEMLDQIGDGGYYLGARASQIRDRLMALENASIGDMLTIQLDDEARFLSRWRDQLLLLLDHDTTPIHRATREEVRNWGGRAAVESVGYRIVHRWRDRLIARMIAALGAEVRASDPSWVYTDVRSEHWAWPLVTEEPPHLLDPTFDSWRDLKVKVLDELLEQMNVTEPTELAGRTWGESNTVWLRHPLSSAVGWLSRWIDLSPEALPGDTQMPRVQQRAHGASERFAVSPGDESAGYFHMPGGQSGHPRSPYYGAGHADWEVGRPTPFLPGPAERTLTVLP